MKKQHVGALALISVMAVTGSALAGTDCGEAARKGDRRMERLDANKDGKVTLPELTQARQNWLTEVDGNKDGAATRAELEAHAKAQHQKRIKTMFERKDANKDGRLTRDESRMPARWFERADANRDGAVTGAELAQAPKHAGKDAAGARRKGAGDKLGPMDQNGDGKVERTEVTAAAARMLERLDRDSDGALSAEELRTRGKGRGHHGAGKGPWPSKGGGKASPATPPKA